jgi:hypothetical protein
VGLAEIAEVAAKLKKQYEESCNLNGRDKFFTDCVITVFPGLV